jgi:hypothetical protein
MHSKRSAWLVLFFGLVTLPITAYLLLFVVAYSSMGVKGFWPSMMLPCTRDAGAFIPALLGLVGSVGAIAFGVIELRKPRVHRLLIEDPANPFAKTD